MTIEEIINLSREFGVKLTFIAGTGGNPGFGEVIINDNSTLDTISIALQSLIDDHGDILKLRKLSNG